MSSSRRIGVVFEELHELCVSLRRARCTEPAPHHVAEHRVNQTHLLAPFVHDGFDEATALRFVERFDAHRANERVETQRFTESDEFDHGGTVGSERLEPIRNQVVDAPRMRRPREVPHAVRLDERTVRERRPDEFAKEQRRTAGEIPQLPSDVDVDRTHEYLVEDLVDLGASEVFQVDPDDVIVLPQCGDGRSGRFTDTKRGDQLYVAVDGEGADQRCSISVEEVDVVDGEHWANRR